MKKIVIIGGGYSGAITAVNLARLSGVPLQIHLIDKNDLPSRGIAYHTRNGSHLLNVAARNMSALADQPNHFVEWLQTRSEYLDLPLAILREKFIPRRVYGDYLQSLFLAYSSILSVEKNTHFEVVHGEATALTLKGAGAEIILDSGGILSADHVILAVGNKPPAALPLRGLELGSRRSISNPWIGWEKQLPSSEENILLVGTGLTMVDTVLSLLDLEWSGKIYATSRNGLLPLSHFRGFDYAEFPANYDLNISLRKIYALFKRHYRDLKAQGRNPAILVDKLRPYTQRIWQSFSVFEKAQFNRHLRTRWNIQRHRIAPEIHERLQGALADGRLEIIKGRLQSAEEIPEKISFTIETQNGKRIIDAGTVINCTGPREGVLPPENSLFAGLFASGTIVADELNMGIQVAPNLAVIDREGHPSRVIYAVGSILKGTLWESVAVPELRSQAFRVAENITIQRPIAEVFESVIEYSI